MKKKVLFLCTGNSCRSQMAEGLLRHRNGQQYEVYSAGTKPSTVNPKAIKIMKEIGVDISDHRSKSVDEFLNQPVDIVVTVCDNAKESCPLFPGTTRQIHWSFIDPAEAEGNEEEVLAVFRTVRNQIHKKVEDEFRKGLSLQIL